MEHNISRQRITRKGEFDAAHRVMHERVKCNNIHGHRFGYELEFSFLNEESLGYAIDFKEIKRVACAFIDDKLDHGSILNPRDRVYIKCCNDLGTKTWLMSLHGIENDCNPSAEHISKELFMAISMLMDTDNIRLEKIVLYETPNCWVECTNDCITKSERENFYKYREEEILKYREEKGIFEYDVRNIK